MNRSLIVLVEDDAIISELLAFNLENEGYATRSYQDGDQLLSEIARLPDISLFILDIMLPGRDGFEICAELKKMPAFEQVPVLMLTARGAERDKVRGLETGADDYLTKPFGMRELMARVQVLLRRYQQLQKLSANRQDAATGTSAEQSVSEMPGQIRSGELLLDDTRHRVFKQGQELEMTHREYELLKFLMSHRGVAYSRDDLLNRVWGYEYSGETRTVDVHIRQLRKKIEDDDTNPRYIETVRGRGYRFTDQI